MWSVFSLWVMCVAQFESVCYPLHSQNRSLGRKENDNRQRYQQRPTKDESLADCRPCRSGDCFLVRHCLSTRAMRPRRPKPIYENFLTTYFWERCVSLSFRAPSRVSSFVYSNRRSLDRPRASPIGHPVWPCRFLSSLCHSLGLWFCDR